MTSDMGLSDDTIRAVLVDAHHTLVSLLAAMSLNADTDTIHHWTDRLYDQLRDQLDDEGRIRAIVLLLQHQASRATVRLLDSALPAGPG